MASINDKKRSIKTLHGPVLVLKKGIHWPLLMIKKVNKKYTLTCTSIKKNIHWPLLMIKKG